MKIRFYIFLVVFATIISSCGFDNGSKSYGAKLANTNWQVEAATRNNKLTQTLDNGFYRISGDTVTTNLTQTLDSIQTTFQFNNGKISHKDERAMSFEVAKMTSDTLILVTDFKNYKFHILLIPEA